MRSHVTSPGDAFQPEGAANAKALGRMAKDLVFEEQKGATVADLWWHQRGGFRLDLQGPQTMARSWLCSHYHRKH